VHRPADCHAPERKPITDEDWGLRRFFVRDPNGAVSNITEHR
jgi:hypothetical protein